MSWSSRDPWPKTCELSRNRKSGGSCSASGRLQMIRDRQAAKSCRARSAIVSGRVLVESSTRSRTPDLPCWSSRLVIVVTSIEAADKYFEPDAFKATRGSNMANMALAFRNHMSPSEVFAQISVVSPAFERVTKEHHSDNSELLPHLLMGDLLRYLGAYFQAHKNKLAPSSLDEVQVILALLDAAMVSGNAETENVVAVSFIENVDTEPFFEQLRPLLGIALRRELNRQSEWEPER